MSGDIKNETPGTEDEEEGETEQTVSEIVSMSEEERESHYRNLAAAEEHLMESVFDPLLLPGIHENTSSYGGRVGLEDAIQFEFPDAENRADRTTVGAAVGEEGYFRIDMAQYDFSAGENIIVRISGEYPQEQVFELPVHAEEEGKETIQVR